jgi:hypothetical protein
VSRKILLGLIIVFAVGVYLFLESKKVDKHEEQEFASTSLGEAPTQNITEVKHPVVETPVTHEPSQAEIRASGKYAYQNIKPKSSIEVESAKRDQYLAQNRTGLVFDSADQKFVLMKLRAAKEKSSEDSNRALDHQLFPIDAQVAQKVLVDDNSYPVVYRESNGRIGLLTGVILIQTNENSEAEKLSLNYPMDLKIYDSSIGLATYAVRSGEGLYDVYNRIKNTERIRSITVEVLDSYKGY